MTPHIIVRTALASRLPRGGRSIGGLSGSSPDVALKVCPNGFTLVEMLITIVIMGILAAIAVPSFDNLVLSNRLSSAANRLVASAQIARGEAIKRNAAVTLCMSSDGTSCTTTGTWDQGWIVFGGGAVLHREQALPSGLKLVEAASKTSLSFPATGINTGLVSSFTACRDSPSIGNQNRVVNVIASGAASVTKNTGVSTCP